MLQNRSIEVLRAIVQEYIQTREPVGSKTLVDRHDFGVSSATIRNDMALLEEEQLIVAPHTSSGRVPTDKGYRLFVDRLAELKPLSSPERSAIETFLDSSSDLDEVLARAVKVLAKLTNQIAMIQYPALGSSKVRSVELVSVSENKVLLLLVLDNARIEQHQIDFTSGISGEFIAEVRAKLNTLLEGRSLTTVPELIQDFENNFAPASRSAVSQLLDALVKTVDANRTEKLVVAGTGNLARNEGDFSHSITPLLDAIEEQVVLVRLLNEMQSEHLGVGLRIGRENQTDGLREATIMSAGYQDQNQEVAKLGLIGPTRMDYSLNISAVQAVARYLSKILQA